MYSSSKLEYNGRDGERQRIYDVRFDTNLSRCTQTSSVMRTHFPRRPWTDIFTPKDTSIDRRMARRTVPMKVLVLGLGRTGTTSVRAALKRLGYVDTYHMMSASIENPLDCLLWQQAFASKYDGIGEFGKAEWDQLLGHCQAVADWPAIAFSYELLQAYPDAKVILPGRNVDTWHASVMKTVYWRVTEPRLRFVSRFDWGAGLYHPMLRKFFDTFFEGDFPNRGKEIYLRHYDQIRQWVPAHNLLEYNVSQGWGPLCEFLGDREPDEVFPSSNDVDSFVMRCNSRTTRQFCNVLFRYFTYLVAALILYNIYIVCERVLRSE